ncbi:hypothetical protein [Halomonas sp. A29]|uniref:hypothetical protein n=1 Tax=Halomonas sp. A29 TaxID=3102786 RepID=UPI00398B4AC7
MEILSWNPISQSSSITDGAGWKKPYSYLQHAERLLSHCCDEHYRIDCILNLNRAIDHRVKLLAALYRFKKIPVPEKPEKILDMLGYFGVARPAMLRELSSVRNLLEHQYKDPPPLRRCQELTEFTWYFLKSTDYLSTSVLQDFVLYPDDMQFSEQYWLEVSYGPDSEWKCSIRGRVPADFVGDESSGGWIVLASRLERKEKLSKGCMVNDELEGEDMHENDLYIVADVLVGEQIYRDITGLYFSVL